MYYSGCYIELTSNCNLKCKHCALNKDDHDFHLSFPRIIKAIDFFIGNGLRCVYLSGGEPLLYDRFHDLCEYLSLQEKIEWEIVTNGTLLSEEMCDFLSKQRGLRCVNLSLDGACAETHDFNRGIGTFNSVIDSIERLKKHGFENRINIQMVLAKYNFFEIDDFKKLAETYHVTYKFIRLSILGEAKKNIDDLLLDKHLINGANEIIKKTNNKEEVAFSCPLIKSDHKATTYIDYLGNVFLCKKLRYTNRDVGNIYSQIIDNSKLQILLKDIYSYSIDMSECGNCSIKAYCKKGCFGKSVLNQSHNDGMCQERFSLFASKLLKKIRKEETN